MYFVHTSQVSTYVHTHHLPSYHAVLVLPPHIYFLPYTAQIEVISMWENMVFFYDPKTLENLARMSLLLHQSILSQRP